MIGAILALLLGIALLIWTAHIVLHVIAWIVIVAAAVWIVRYLLSNRNRSDL